jgi:hypothetical protein
MPMIDEPGMREPAARSLLLGLLFALLRLLLVALAMVAPLVALGVQALGEGAVAIGVFALSFSGLFLLCVFCPGLPGLQHLSRHVGLPLRPGESLPHYNRRIGLLLMVVGAVLVSACIFGLP